MHHRTATTVAVVVALAAVVTSCGSGSSTTATTAATTTATTSVVSVTAAQQTDVPTTTSSTRAPDTTTTSTSTTAPTTTSATVAAAVVGRVTRADGGTVGRPPRRPQNDDPLHPGDPVATGQTELVEFALTRKITGCKLFGNSQVTVAPQTDVLLAIGSGTVLCRTSNKPGKETLQIAGRPVTVSDPVFLVEAGDGSAVTMHVIQGAVGVKATDGWHAYGAGQVVSWSGPGLSGALGGGGWGDITELPEVVRADVAAYQKVVAAQTGTIAYPSLAPSSVIGRQVAASLVLAVQVDSSGDPDHTAFALVNGLFDQMAQRWKLQPRVVPVDNATAGPRPGAAKGPNVLVTPHPAPGVTKVPLFSTPDGVDWYAVLPQGDKTGAASMASFLRALLATTCPADNPGRQAPLGQSCYEQLYRQAYDRGGPVPLDVLAGLLGVA